MVTQFWDDEQRRAERRAALVDPNPHLRAGRDQRLQAALAREVEKIQRREVPSVPSHFLPPEQRATTTTPAGTSAYSIPDPRPHTRLDANAERLLSAAFYRGVADRQRLSGSHDEHARTRTF